MSAAIATRERTKPRSSGRIEMAGVQATPSINSRRSRPMPTHGDRVRQRASQDAQRQDPALPTSSAGDGKGASDSRAVTDTDSRRKTMGMTNDGLSYWQAETGGIDLLEMTIGDLLDRRADELPLQEAVVYSCCPEFEGSHEVRWTYQQYRERANQVACGLMALGLNKGDHLAVWATNLPEWALLEMAAAKAGLVLVTVNPAYRAHELEYVLKQGDVRALFLMAQVRDHDCLATLHSLVTPGARNGDVSSERLPLLRSVCLIGTVPEGVLDQEGWRPTLCQEMVAAS